MRRLSTCTTRRISLVAADHRVELAEPGRLREVAAELLQRLVGFLGVLRRDPLTAADVLEGGHQPFAVDTEFLQQPAGGTLVVGHREDEVLDGEEVVLEFLGLVLGLGEQFVETAGEVVVVRRSGRTRDAGQFLQFSLEADGQRLGGDAGLLEDGRGQPAFLIEQGEQQMLDIDLLVAHPDGNLLRTLDGLPGFLGETADIHEVIPFPGPVEQLPCLREIGLFSRGCGRDGVSNWQDGAESRTLRAHIPGNHGRPRPIT